MDWQLGEYGFRETPSGRRSWLRTGGARVKRSEVPAAIRVLAPESEKKSAGALIKTCKIAYNDEGKIVTQPKKGGIGLFKWWRGTHIKLNLLNLTTSDVYGAFYRESRGVYLRYDDPCKILETEEDLEPFRIPNAICKSPTVTAVTPQFFIVAIDEDSLPRYLRKGSVPKHRSIRIGSNIRHEFDIVQTGRASEHLSNNNLRVQARQSFLRFGGGMVSEKSPILDETERQGGVSTIGVWNFSGQKLKVSFYCNKFFTGILGGRKMAELQHFYDAKGKDATTQDLDRSEGCFTTVTFFKCREGKKTIYLPPYCIGRYMLVYPENEPTPTRIATRQGRTAQTIEVTRQYLGSRDFVVFYASATNGEPGPPGSGGILTISSSQKPSFVWNKAKATKLLRQQ